MKKLGFGLMRLPLENADDASSVHLGQTYQMADYFIANGFTYFDTAYMYHNGTSEKAVRSVLIERHDRSAFTVASKLPTMMLKEKNDLQRIFSEQLSRTGAGYFDYYLLHALDKKNYDTAVRLNCFDFVADLKQRGLVKKVGFSFHDSAEMLDKILTEHPEMEFVQLQINYLDWEDENVQSRLCYETAVKHGKPVIVMEPVKGGRLADLPSDICAMFASVHPDWSPASWAIRFAASLPQVFMVLSGMSNLAQVEDNVSFMKDFTSLNDAEMSVVKRAAAMLRGNVTIECTACRYCTESCPKHIAIPEYFALYNKYKEIGSLNDEIKSYRELGNRGYGKASDCIECRKCEKSCPQHLPITSYLKKVSNKFEGGAIK